MYICVIRHGETDWNVNGRIQGRIDVPLNTNGRDQAEFCATALKFKKWDVIVSSTLKRAKETAEIIAQKLHIEDIYENEKLVERDYGKATGIVREEYLEKNSTTDWEKESKIDLAIRMRSAIDEIANSFFPKNVLVISHGSAICSLFSTFPSKHEGQPIEELKNACISLLNFDGKCYNTVFYNKEFNEVMEKSKLWKSLT